MCEETGGRRDERIEAADGREGELCGRAQPGRGSVEIEKRGQRCAPAVHRMARCESMTSRGETSALATSGFWCLSRSLTATAGPRCAAPQLFRPTVPDSPRPPVRSSRPARAILLVTSPRCTRSRPSIPACALYRTGPRSAQRIDSATSTLAAHAHVDARRADLGVKGARTRRHPGQLRPHGRRVRPYQARTGQQGASSLSLASRTGFCLAES